MGQSDTPETHFTLRIDEVGDSTCEKILLWSSGQSPLCKRVLMTSERTRKLHYHLYFEYLSPLKPSALRKRVHRAFSNRGGTMAFAICKKPEVYVSYILKDVTDTNKIVYKKGFTEVQIVDYKARSYKKTVNTSIPFQIHQEIQMKFDKDPPTYDDIQSFVVRWYKVRHKAMTFSYMAGVVHTVESYYREAAVIDEFRQYMGKQ